MGKRKRSGRHRNADTGVGRVVWLGIAPPAVAPTAAEQARESPRLVKKRKQAMEAVAKAQEAAKEYAAAVGLSQGRAQRAAARE